MKNLKLYLLLLSFFFVAGKSIAQAPQAIPYQAIARDSIGNLIANQNIGLRISILDSSATAGSVVYEETQSIATDAFGLFTINVGLGVVTAGNMSSINWGSNAKFIRVEMDATGGTNYILMGTSQLLSVPYSLYSASSSITPASSVSSVNDTANTITNDCSDMTKSSINLSGLRTSLPSGTINVTVNITMNIVGGLQMYLVAPNGDVLNLAYDDGGIGNNFTNTVFSDAGTTSIFGKAAPFTGTYKPHGNIATSCTTTSTVATFGALGGGTINPNGTWSLILFESGNHTGTLNNWSIYIPDTSVANYLPKWTAAGALTHTSLLYDDGTNVGIGTGLPQSTLDVRKDAAGALGPVLSISNYGGGPGSSSAMDFYTYNPAIPPSDQHTGGGGSTGPQVHIAAVDDGNHSDNLTFNIKSTGSIYNPLAEVMRLTSTGMVGINNPAPVSTLQVTNGAVLFDGTTGNTPVSGAGSRMMWVPAKNAFRAGSVDATGTYWDDSNIGLNSVAFGSNTVALGASSTSIGYLALAKGDNSFAGGQSCGAFGPSSIALGSQSTAFGASSAAIGNQCVASGDNSFVAGQGCSAGNNSISLGVNMGCIGCDNVYSIGNNTVGNDGYVHGATLWFGVGELTGSSYNIWDAFEYTNGNYTGNDAGPPFTLNGGGVFFAHAPSGYFFGTDLDNSHGVYLQPGDGSWSSLSDRRKKANFQPINSEEVLQKIGSLPITQWNYTSQPTTFHHIGPMAQDFFAAFHLDGVSDTTINSLDIDGINMAGIQALKIRTDELKQKTDELEKLNATVAAMQKQLNAMQALLVKEGIIPQKNNLTSAVSANKTK